MEILMQDMQNLQVEIDSKTASYEAQYIQLEADVVSFNSCAEVAGCFGSESELNEISPGDSTDPLTSAFTMKSSITGAEFNAMGSVDISIDGYLVDSEAGTDPVSVWGMIQ